jgi:hypothetical protein
MSITSVLTSPGAAASVVISEAPLPETMSASFSPPEPTWARSWSSHEASVGVEIADVAVGIDGEEAGRRVIEIVDGVLQLLEDVLLALAVARHVGDGPQGQLAAAFRIAERADAEPEPAHNLLEAR